MSNNENRRIAGKRLANKVIWNLEDIQAMVMELWSIDMLEPWLDAVRRAEAQHDEKMLLYLEIAGGY